jgi:hypothetical protein
MRRLGRPCIVVVVDVGRWWVVIGAEDPSVRVGEMLMVVVLLMMRVVVGLLKERLVSYVAKKEGKSEGGRNEKESSSRSYLTGVVSSVNDNILT